MGLLLKVSYDGTGYCGWQEQKNGLSVQEVLSGAIGEALGCDFTLLGASRTDAGVHALGQRAHVICAAPCRVPANRLPLVLNTLLPADIRVVGAAVVPDDFHPINDAIGKTYQYAIYNSRYHNPLMRNYAAHVPVPLDAAKMAAAAAHFVGEHDFAAFCARGSSVKSTVRRVYALDVAKRGDIIEITVSGNGFLYNMVRIIAGTLVNVGRGRAAPGDIPSIITSGDRARAGKTMPPQGLTLMEVCFPEY